MHTCNICQATVRTAQGLKSHYTRLHGSRVNEEEEDLTPLQRQGPSSAQTNNIHNASQNASQDITTQVPGDNQIDSQSVRKNIIDRLSCIKSTTKTLRRIPKGARTDAANALSNCIDKCLQDNTDSSWERLLLFTSMCLQVPQNQEDNRVSLTTLVKRNVSAFNEGITNIPENFTRKPTITKINKKHSPKAEDHLSRQVEAKLSEGDIRGAIRTLSSDDTFIPQNEDTFTLLQQKHPDHDKEPSYLPEPNDTRVQPLTVSESEVKAAIASFPAGSAGGIDMMRPQHLKDLISFSSGNAGTRLISSLTKLCNLMLRGQVPRNICPTLYGASLCAFKKKDGGVRPIAIGCTFRRLVAKLGCYHIFPNLGNTLQPHQLGFGTKSGAEVAAHSVRLYLGHHHNQAKVLLKIDLKNAFNSINRDSVLNAVSVHAPNLYPFLQQCYKWPSFLSYGGRIISSCRGIQQGDPLGSALFSMTVLPISSQMNSELNIWYLDDITLADTPEKVIQDYLQLSNLAAGYGLEVNTHKCELFHVPLVPTHHQTDLFQEIPGLKFPTKDNCTLLGAPLTVEAIESCLDGKIRALELMSSRLAKIPAHCAYFLLKNSFAIPKLIYILRCAPTWKRPDILSSYDEVLKKTLESITNTQISEEAWEQAMWPVSKGGLGIRQASKSALPAFLASSHGASNIINKILPLNFSISDNTLEREGLQIWQNERKLGVPPINEIHSQRVWENISTEESIGRQRECASNLKTKARLIAVSAPESGSFLNAIPSAQLGTKMENEEFRVAIALRLGANMCQPHICICDTLVDNSGTHGLSCKKVSGRFFRHATVNDLIKRALASANIPSILEPSYLESNNHKRPDGITMIPWTQGRPLVWDFTCCDSLAPSYLASSSVTPLHVATNAEKMKKTKYEHLQHSHIVTPIAAECLGGIAKDSLNFLRTLGKKITAVSGEKQATAYLLQRISLAIQRGNASAILGTLPTSASLNAHINLL